MPAFLVALLKFVPSWALPGLGFVGSSLKLLLDPKVWLLLVVAWGYGFIRGCQDASEKYEEKLSTIERIGQAAEERRKEINQRNLEARDEIAAESIDEMLRLGHELDDANERLRQNAGSGFVPRPRPRSDRDVSASGPSEREQSFLRRVYSGELVCYDRNRLDEGMGSLVEGLRQRSSVLAVNAIAALVDQKLWGIWASKVESCPQSWNHRPGRGELLPAFPSPPPALGSLELRSRPTLTDESASP